MANNIVSITSSNRYTRLTDLDLSVGACRVIQRYFTEVNPWKEIDPLDACVQAVVGEIDMSCLQHRCERGRLYKIWDEIEKALKPYSVRCSG